MWYGMRLAMPKAWAPKKTRPAPRKVYSLRNVADTQSSWYTELQQRRVSCFGSSRTGSIQLGYRDPDRDIASG